MNRLLRKTEFSREDVSRVAYMNWEKDGSPIGRDKDYWLEAEQQLSATWHLLTRELGIKKPAGRKAKAPAKKANPGQPGAIKFAARPKAE